MKIHNRFIAVGLGIGLSFMGTYMSYSWFTDSASQNHIISIEKLIEESINCKYDTCASISTNQKNIKISIPSELQPVNWIVDKNRNAKLEITGTKGEMEKTNLDMDPSEYFKDASGFITQRYETIQFTAKNDTNKFDINNIDEHQKGSHVYPKENNYIDVKIKSDEGPLLGSSKWRVDEYRVVVTKYKDGHEWKLQAHWIPLAARVKIDLEEELPEREEDNATDQVNPPTTDDTLENENNGAVTLPELENEGDEENKNPEQIPDKEASEEQPSENQPETLSLEEENQ